MIEDTPTARLISYKTVALMNDTSRVGIITIVNSIQHVFCIIAVAVNATLLVLIQTKSRKELGNYRHLMTTFCIFSVLFTVLEDVIEPSVQMKEGSFAIFILTQGYRSKTTALIVLCIYAAVFSGLLGVLALHFAFRFCNVVKKEYMKYFEGYRFFLIWPPVLCMPLIMYFCFCFLILGPTPEKTSHIQEKMWFEFNLTTDEYTYIGAHYFVYIIIIPIEKHFQTLDNDGNRVYNYLDCLSMFFVSLYTAGIGSLLIFCGYHTYAKLLEKNDRDVTKAALIKQEKQKQLFRALMAQTIIPMVVVYTPCAVLYFSPLLGVSDVGFYTNLILLLLSVYSVLDPICAIYFIEDYRNALLNRFWSSSRVFNAVDDTYVSERSQPNEA